MAQSKIEKMASIDEEIRQLTERKKLLRQQHNKEERTARTKRLCQRMGLIESMLPDTITLTDEQFQLFLEKTVLTDSSRRILTEIGVAPIHPISSKSAETAPDNGADRSADEGAAQG
jgi:hypothetical protein